MFLVGAIQARDQITDQLDNIADGWGEQREETTAARKR